MKSGVYKITHIKSGRSYFGSGLNIYYRMKTHLYHLRRGSHHNAIMQRTWDREGERAFSFSPVLICRPEDRIFYEQLCLDGFRSYERGRGFNIRKVAESNSGLRLGGEKHKLAMQKMFSNPEFRKKRRMPEPGERYGRLVIMELRERTSGSHTWLCKCDCGKEVLKRIGCLRNGHTRSCGCLNSEKSRERRFKHGRTRSKEYIIWQGILARCYNQSNKKYSSVGARGISVCDRWRNSFENFLQDVGYRPSGAIFRRIDISKDYSPDNCIWVPAGTYAKNKSNIRTVKVYGKLMNLSFAAKSIGINQTSLNQRMKNHKESYQQATDHFVSKYCYRQLA